MKSVSLFTFLFAVCGVVSANEAVIEAPEIAAVVEEAAIVAPAPVAAVQEEAQTEEEATAPVAE